MLNKSQHRKLTLQKKILCCSCQDSNSQPFNHESSRLPTSYPISISNITNTFSPVCTWMWVWTFALLVQCKLPLFRLWGSSQGEALCKCSLVVVVVIVLSFKYYRLFRLLSLRWATCNFGITQLTTLYMIYWCWWMFLICKGFGATAALV